MDIQTIIKLFAGDVVKESKLDKNSKIQLLNYIKESDVFEVMNLLNNGKIEKVNENQKLPVLKEFKNSNIPNKIKYFVNEKEYIQEVEPITVLLGLAAGSAAYRALKFLGLTSIVGYVGVKGIQKLARQFQSCHKPCRKLKGNEYQLCKTRCEIDALENKIKILKSTNCSKAKDPEKCKKKIKKELETTQKKINNKKETLKYSGKN